MKICNKCRFELPFDNFCKNKNTKDGYHRYCRECKKKENLINKQYNINYYFNNKQTYIEKYYLKQNLIKKDKYKNDYTYKVSMLMRNRLSKILKRNKIYKNNTTISLLGCNFKEFKNIIEKQFQENMNWDNHGLIWELDHIKPILSFNLTDIEQQKQCFHYSNLQPLFKTTKIAESFGYKDQIGNRNKSNKII